MFASLLFAIASAGPTVLEGTIDAQASTIKVEKPSQQFLAELENRFGVNPKNLFTLQGLQHVPLLDVASIEGPEADASTSVVIAKSGNKAPSYLMAPLAMAPEALEGLLHKPQAFLNVILPGSQAQINQGFREYDEYDESEDEDDYEPRGVVAPFIETVLLSFEDAWERFTQRYMKIDLTAPSALLPDSVKEALRSSTQAIVHPTSYLQVPEGMGSSGGDQYAITSATPIEIILGLFERVF